MSQWSPSNQERGLKAPFVATLIGGVDPDGNIQAPIFNASGEMKVQASVSISSSGAAIQDGVNPLILATVKDYTNSNPLAVINVDTNGDPTGGAAVSIADGADATQGAKADAFTVDPTATKTVVAILKGLLKVLTDVWNSTLHTFRMEGAGTAGTAAGGVVTVQGVASMTKLLVTPDLPSGASTAANQASEITAINATTAAVAAVQAQMPDLGTAGSPASDVITVQGITSMTPFAVTGPLTDTQLRATPVPISGTVTTSISGVATAANQTNASQKTQIVDGSGNVAGQTSNALDVNIKSGSSGLPSGASTSALQTTGNTSLSSIDGKTPALGQALAAASVPVVLPAAQITTLTPPAAITGFALEAGHIATIDTSTAAISAAAGATSGAKVITDANGTIQQYLRGLIYQSITAGAFLVTAAISAGTNLIGKVVAGQSVDAAYSGTTALTPKFAVITASSSGATTLVAAVTSKKIVVTQVVLMANGTNNVKFQSHVTPTDLTGLLYLAVNTGFAPGYDPTGHFQTVAGEALDINLSASVAVGGWLKYLEV